MSVPTILTGREKIEAAFSPDGTPAFPAVVCYPGIFLRDHLAELTKLPWWQAQEPDPARQASYYEQLVSASGIDWFELGPGFSREEQQQIRLVEKSDGIYHIDARTGQVRRLEPPVVSGTLSVLRDQAPVIDDPEPFLQAHVQQAPAFTGIEPGRADLSQLLLGALPKLFPFQAVSAPLWALSSVLGHEQWFSLLATDPEPLYDAAQRLLHNSIQWVKYSAALGCRAIWLEDCLTDQIGPARFAQYHLPLLQQLTAAIRAAGMHSIHYFCGNPWPVWELLMTSGADAIALEESKKQFHIDIDEVVARVQGRMVVLGNLDAWDILERGSREELRREIARQLDAGRRNHGRFIMSTGSPVTPGTPAARVREYAALVRKLGG